MPMAMIDSIRFDETVAALYRAATGRGAFGDAFAMISESLDLLGCQMIGVDASTGALTFSQAEARIPTESELEYIRAYHKVDPRIPTLLSRAPGHWLYCQDMFREEEALAHPYYRDLLIPYGGRHSATAKLYQDDREIVLIGLLSRLGQPGFMEGAREYIERIGLHLREAATIYMQVRSLATGHAVGVELIERLGKPAWIIDDGLQILGSNDLAKAALQREDGLRDANGRLIPASAERSNDLAASVRALIQRAERGEAAPRSYLRLRGAQQVASLSLFEPRETMQLFGKVRRFLVMLHQPSARPEPDLYLWQVAFDLTPAEARACHMVYGGATLKEAAERLGVSVNTVNTQLDGAYAKVGVRNKVELVQRLGSLE